MRDWKMARQRTPRLSCVPRAIVKHVCGWAIVHGEHDMLAVKPTIHACMMLILEWKERNHCESWHIDNLFIFDKIEW